MQKKIFILAIFLLSSLTLTIFYVHLNKKYNQAVVELKYGRTEESIKHLESIKYFSPRANKMLFEIYINNKFSINDPQKAIIYLNRFSENDKKQIINTALIYYELTPLSRRVLDEQMRRLN